MQFKILPYNEDNLALSLQNKLISLEEIKKKNHFKYLLDYLGGDNDGVNAKTILIEYNYVSKAYLSDYSNYYSSCFNDYEKKTNRVHLFKISFDESTFLKKLLQEVPNDDFWKSYLGYIVAKPLPDALIGPTLLATYSVNDESKRNFTAIRKYYVHLFGKKLSVNTLIYQEQDTVLAACATTALWSAFHKTSDMFDTPLPSPSEITSAAGNLFFASGRTFPSHGLEYYQICKAIESVGLVSELRNRLDFVNNLSLLKSFIYGYLKFGLPVLLGINIKGIGNHLITITGYRDLDLKKRISKDISVVGEQIDKFYAHDDQIGPFSRLEFHKGDILTAWWEKDNLKNKLHARITAVFVPLHPKIRITYEDIYTQINLIDFLLYSLFSFPLELIWDIYLDYSNNLKELLKKHKNINDEYKLSLILKQLPRFIWRSQAIVGNEIIFELIYDATDISRGFYCVQIIFYNSEFRNKIAEILKDKGIQELFREKIGNNYLNLFITVLNIDKLI